MPLPEELALSRHRGSDLSMLTELTSFRALMVIVHSRHSLIPGSLAKLAHIKSRAAHAFPSRLSLLREGPSQQNQWPPIVLLILFPYLLYWLLWLSTGRGLPAKTEEQLESTREKGRNFYLWLHS
jgi:hypothetical protein